MFRSRVCTTGLQAAAKVAYQLSDLLCISTFSRHELGLDSSEQGNLWGEQTKLLSDASAPEALLALRATLHAGGFASALLPVGQLMACYHQLSTIALEQLPAVVHLSTVKQPEKAQIGDFSELMALRNAGWGLLVGGSVQEAHDLALIAHAAALYSRIPFLHAIEAQIASASLALIEALSEEQLRSLIDAWALLSQRQTAITPERPEARLLALDSRLGFESLQASRASYQQCSAVLEELFARFAELTGRAYGLCEYVGANDAERVLVAMGTAAQTARPAVEALQASGEKVGLITIRLLRPFPQEAFLACLPSSVKRLAVLDSSYEAGAPAPALCSEIGACLLMALQNGAWQGALPTLCSGIYGLYGKALSQTQIGAVFAELERALPKQHFSLGIEDDLLGSSLRLNAWQPQPDVARHSAFWYGLEEAALLEALAVMGNELAEGELQLQAQRLADEGAYGLQWAAKGVALPASIDEAELLICPSLEALEKHYDKLAQGGRVLLISRYEDEQLIQHLSPQVAEQLWLKQQELLVFDAEDLAERSGQTVERLLWLAFCSISGLAEGDQRVKAALKRVERRQLLTQQGEYRPQPQRNDADELFEALLKGWPVPVSALPNDGRYPTGSSVYLLDEKTSKVAVWNGQNCNQCGLCSAICPQGALQAKLVASERLEQVPSQMRSLPARLEGLEGYEYILQVQPELCNGCGLCVEICPDASLELRLQPDYRSEEWIKWNAFQNLPDYQPTLSEQNTLKLLQFRASYLKAPADKASLALRACLHLLSKLGGQEAILVYDPALHSLNAPFSPWQSDARGRGPSWLACHWSETVELCHHLAECLAHQTARARALLAASSLQAAAALRQILEQQQERPEALRQAVAQLKRQLADQIAEDPDPSSEDVQLLAQADQLIPKQIWGVLEAEKLRESDWHKLQALIEQGSHLKLLLICRDKAALERIPARLCQSCYQAQIALAANPYQAVQALQTAHRFAGSALIWACSVDPRQSDAHPHLMQPDARRAEAATKRPQKALCNCLSSIACRCASSAKSSSAKADFSS